MKYVLFLLGFFCWIDWLPYLDPSLVEFFNYSVVFLFFLKLLNNVKFLFPLSSLQFILLAYLIYMILSTILNFGQLKYSIILNCLIIVLILARQFSGTKHMINGFVFGGVTTSLYMILMIFDIISISDLSVLDKFDLGEWFMRSKESLISIGFTNKYNKLSYLFSFLVCILFTRLRIQTIFKIIFTTLILYLQIKTTGRGGMLISLSYICYLASRSNMKYLIAPAVSVILYFFVNSFIFQDLGNRFAFDNSSSLSRLYQYNFAIENFSDNLMFGIGYISISDLVGASYIHNFFLNNLLMGGLIGFTL